MDFSYSFTCAIYIKKIARQGTSLVVQWLRIHLPMQETRVQSLVREDPTCPGGTKPMAHNYWACAGESASHNYWAHGPQLLKLSCLESMPHSTRSHHRETPTHRNKSSPGSPQLGKAPTQQGEPCASINKQTKARQDPQRDPEIQTIDWYHSDVGCFGEGNGNPLQYSCLQNPMDRGPWRAIVHGVRRVRHDLTTKPPPPRLREVRRHQTTITNATNSAYFRAWLADPLGKESINLEAGRQDLIR